MAFQLDDMTRAAFSIVFANMERPKGQKFDFSTMAFPDVD